jgi:hypothetical protein
MTDSLNSEAFCEVRIGTVNSFLTLSHQPTAISKFSKKLTAES